MSELLGHAPVHEAEAGAAEDGFGALRGREGYFEIDIEVVVAALGEVGQGRRLLQGAGHAKGFQRVKRDNPGGHAAAEILAQKWP